MMDEIEPHKNCSEIGLFDKKERRILGTLIEKSLTTPEYYPLTLKALATGSNQKNNRSPLTQYSEDDLEATLEQLQQRRLVALIHTAGGRSERYRHLLKDVAGWNHQQLAIMSELLLRGRQQVGELRTRASRMAPLETLEDLRAELELLMHGGFVQATGDLQRRGVEVDHNFYLPQENRQLEWQGTAEPQEKNPTINPVATVSATPVSQPQSLSRPAVAAAEISELQRQLQALTSSISQLTENISSLDDRLRQLEQQLGV